jgi:vitamin B12/bleomycin/antimicrobial peptide transport system ATP-binding/permease protein
MLLAAVDKLTACIRDLAEGSWPGPGMFAAAIPGPGPGRSSAERYGEVLATTLDWQHEWSASLGWSAMALVGVIAVSTVAVWLLSRFTCWGQRLWRIVKPYFRPHRSWISWRPLLMLLVMLWLTVLGVRMEVLVSYAMNGLFTAMQQLNSEAFTFFFTIVASLAMALITSMTALYLVGQAFNIHWRIWLTDHLVGDWLDGCAYHRGQFLATPVDNPDQRIQEDITSFVANSETLALGAVKAMVSLISFTPVLWTLSGPLSIFGYTLPRAMVFLVYVFVIMSSVVAFRIGRPLIRLNFLNEELGASFRYALVRLRDHSESIAFYHGEKVERTTLTTRFAAVITNSWAIAFRRAKFQGFNIAVSQIALLLPYAIQAPSFFRRVVTLGDVQQTATAFAQVQQALSFFRDSYDIFATYRATLNRLAGLLDANNHARALPSITVVDCPDRLIIEDLTVRRPDGKPLIKSFNLQLNPGQALLVTGTSGCGKTSLLRSLADLWPHAQGTIRRPVAGHVLFLSQQPYLPLGDLRTALAYPQASHSADDEYLRQVLQKVQLSHLEDRIEDHVDWSRVLSPGERQRLAFARILVNRPRLVFLDEATSAVDEGTEYALYTLIRTEMPECMLVSVGHRGTLKALHTDYLELLGEGRWNTIVPIDHRNSVHRSRNGKSRKISERVLSG